MADLSKFTSNEKILSEVVAISYYQICSKTLSLFFFFKFLLILYQFQLQLGNNFLAWENFSKHHTKC